ncbi:MAG: MFS transporter, partial [Chloroflexi bacterium]|nr:MFS transporter [Chloroflexota bacterium]
MGRKLSYKLDPLLLALLPLCLGVFLGALDQTVVVTALPSMIVDLQVPFRHLDQATWIVTGYLLGYTVAMPLVGRLSDVYGRRRLYLWCLVAFFGGSLLAARAGDLPELVLARVVQAAGGGGLLPVTLAIASDIFPDRRRTLALGFTAAIAEAGGVIGPLYGAAITNALGWRWVFYINLPLAPIIGVLVYRLCRESQAERERIDFGGAATLSVALAALTLGLSQASGEQSVLPEAVG